MDNQAPLQALRDLHLGKPIGWWPLAYGWYIVIFAVCLILIALGFWLHNYLKHKRPKTAALKQLNLIKQQYHQHTDPNKTAFELTKLLKCFSFAYLPRQQIASLHGQAWQDYLGNEAWCLMLCHLSYAKHQDEDLTTLFNDIERWIKRFDPKGKKCLK